ncbi:MAG: SUMF1/EgtB/PvdO family nonheme iron enzyme [Acidobacteria bacterium]|nr:SUMF1/EgtB/PvdO family nonheme iron enzyme [Acidobacteriota bacterium]
MPTRCGRGNNFFIRVERQAVPGSNRVNRGGSWNNNAVNCRSANRNRNTPGKRDNNLGFRLVSTQHCRWRKRLRTWRACKRFSPGLACLRQRLSDNLWTNNPSSRRAVDFYVRCLPSADLHPTNQGIYFCVDSNFKILVTESFAGTSRKVFSN